MFKEEKIGLPSPFFLFRLHLLRESSALAQFVKKKKKAKETFQKRKKLGR